MVRVVNLARVVPPPPTHIIIDNIDVPLSTRASEATLAAIRDRLLTDAELRRALREELDMHTTFQWEHFLHQGVDAHFIARTVDPDRTEKPIAASSVWRQVDYKPPFEGELILPRDKRGVAIYSRRAFRYGQLYVIARMPDLTPVGNETWMAYYLGLEHGSRAVNGIASFVLRTDTAAANVLHAVVGGAAPALVKIDVNKPSNFLTDYNRYRVILSRNLVTFTINESPALFAIPCLGYGAVKVKENVLPYSIALTEPLASRLTALIEILTNRTAEAPSDFIAPLSPSNFRVSDGHEVVPMHLPLYVEDTSTRFAECTVSSGTLVSHPFPVFGYRGKTIYFMADRGSAEGGLVLEVYTQSGNWRVYDAVTYAAGKLLVYPIAGEAVLARLSYTPASYPATVLEGEVVLA
ncbi:MAG: hypothetical protein QXT37_10965 [Thermofilaceae archaeon]